MEVNTNKTKMMFINCKQLDQNTSEIKCKSNDV